MYKAVKQNEVKSTSESVKNRSRNTDLIKHDNVYSMDPEGVALGVNNISFVNNIDSSYPSNFIEYQEFRHEVIRPVTSSFNNNPVYDRKLTIDIPREFGYLSAAFIKLTINTGVDNMGDLITVATYPYLSCNLIKTASLRVKGTGTVLQYFNTSTEKMRIDELKKWNSYEKLIESVNPTAGNSITGIDSVYYPLFFSWFQDGAYLPACDLDQLEIYIETNNNHTLCGFQTEFVVAGNGVQNPLVIEGVFKYYNRPNNSRFLTNNLSVPSVPLTNNGAINSMGKVLHKRVGKITNSLKKHYGTNIFYEDTYNIGANAGTQQILLRCNKPVIAIHCYITFTDGCAVDTITGVSLLEGNRTMSAIDFRINYDIVEEVSVQEDSFFSYWVGSKDRRKLDDRQVMNFATQTHKTMNISYPSNPNAGPVNSNVNRILTVWSEYITEFEISPEGSISPDVPGTFLIQQQGH